MAVRERLGSEGILGLIEVLETERSEVIQITADRFERRLALEVSSLRLELHDGLAAVRDEMATTRVELLKWSFAFWIGQVAAMAGLLAFMLRATGR
jgi:hypothetical protein